MSEPSLREQLRALAAQAEAVSPIRAEGELAGFAGLLIESIGPPVSVGDLCEVETAEGGVIRAQTIGFREGRALSIPLEDASGLKLGARVRARREARRAAVGDALLGRVIDGFGAPLDGAGPLLAARFRELQEPLPGPMERRPIAKPLSTGVRVIDALLPCGKGQRVGVFGGSGVGKSTLLGALARNSAADVNVIALVGERNREVRDFIEGSLGDEGLAKSVLVVATSDRPAPVRVRATLLAATIADDFRAQGRDVLLIMDSVTRLAMAQREIGLAAGEPPSQKGYTPSVFQMLPQVFERAGNFERGSVTGFYTVLVEGDDMNEPIADAVRSLLDGHIVLSRELAAANHYPAIDVLESVSRLAPRVSADEQQEWASRLRDSLAAYRRSEDLINLGAYTAGSNPKLDAAINQRDEVVDFLRQDLSAPADRGETLESLKRLATQVS